MAVSSIIPSSVKPWTAKSGSSKRLGEILEDRRAISAIDTQAVLRLQKQLDARDVALNECGTLPEELQLTLGQCWSITVKLHLSNSMTRCSRTSVTELDSVRHWSVSIR